MTRPAPGRDTDAAALDAPYLDLLEAAQRWEAAYYERSRAIHGYRATQKQAADAEFRARQAITLALEEIDSGDVAGARATLANLIDGRPLAAARDDRPAPPPRARRRLASLAEIRSHASGASGPLRPGVRL